MNHLKEKHVRLRKALTAACHEKACIEPGEQWDIAVMSHIRRLGSLHSEISFMLFNSFVWRFAGAACFLVLFLSAYMLHTGFHPEYDMAKVVISDPIEFTFIQYLGI
ncbi:MAG: hypothetical protein BWK80_19930 [Desulfobacteraceae bacterium IS3]|nr:MAG: hypothetical protein BWK80_19930 [Desulfobacteraceae bacterium IS3]